MNMQNDTELSGLSCKEINGILIILDERHAPPKYVGLIKPKAFDKGYNYCPAVKMHLYFDITRGQIPKKFRSASRAWEWTKKYAIRFKDTNNYSFLNKTIPWFAYAPTLFSLLRDFQLQLITIKIAIGILSGIFAHYIESKYLTIACITLVIILGLTAIVDLTLFIHKWRSR